MKKVTQTQFQSDVGFRSENFSVDKDGNLTANSVSVITEVDESSDVVDFTFTDDENGAVFVDPLTGNPPTITLEKTRTYRIDIDFDISSLFFLRENQEDFYTENLKHSSGDSGALAQGKQNGILTITIPADYDQSIIYYTDQEKTYFGEINIINPEGIFSNVTVSNNIIVGNIITAGEEIKTPILATTDIKSNDSLNIDVTGDINILTSDSSVLGKINDTGSTIPVVNTTILNSDINSTVIGNETPALATFTLAKVQQQPTIDIDATNKEYVDTTVTALSIALGI